MHFKKSDDEKAQKRAEREADANATSPIGRAEASHKRGDRFFQIEIDVQPATRSLGDVVLSALALVLPNKNPDATEAPEGIAVLADIERIGWHLEHVGYVYVQTGSSSTANVGGYSTTYSGKSVGIYLFRRFQDLAGTPRS